MVTWQPIRWYACAISAPMGPPPTTAMLSGSTLLSKMSSYVLCGTPCKASGTLGDAPVQRTNRLP